MEGTLTLVPFTESFFIEEADSVSSEESYVSTSTESCDDVSHNIRYPKIAPGPIMYLKGHDGIVTALHFTTENDDILTSVPTLISGSNTGEIFIWDMKFYRTKYRFTGHDGKAISCLHYLKSTLFSQGRDGVACVWNCTNGIWNVIRRISEYDVGFCASNVFSIDEATFFTMFNENHSLMDIYSHDFKREFKTLKIEKSNGMCLCMKVFQMYSKTLILIGYETGYIGLWNYELETEVCSIKVQDEPVMCLDYDSKHRNRGISGSLDKFLETWSITENLQIVKVKRITLKAAGVNAVKIRYDGKIAVAALSDHTVEVYSWKTLIILAKLIKHSQPVQCLTFCALPMMHFQSAHASIFASGSKDRHIAIWSVY